MWKLLGRDGVCLLGTVHFVHYNVQQCHFCNVLCALSMASTLFSHCVLEVEKSAKLLQFRSHAARGLMFLIWKIFQKHRSGHSISIVPVLGT